MPDVEEAWAAADAEFGWSIRMLGPSPTERNEIRAEQAAVRDAMLAAYDRGHGVAGNLFLRERARIQALGNPQGGQGSGESEVAGPDGGKEGA